MTSRLKQLNDSDNYSCGQSLICGQYHAQGIALSYICRFLSSFTAVEMIYKFMYFLEKAKGI